MDMKIVIEIDSVLLICGVGTVFSQVKKGIPSDTLPEWQKCLKNLISGP